MVFGINFAHKFGRLERSEKLIDVGLKILQGALVLQSIACCCRTAVRFEIGIGQSQIGLEHGGQFLGVPFDTLSLVAAGAQEERCGIALWQFGNIPARIGLADGRILSSSQTAASSPCQKGIVQQIMFFFDREHAVFVLRPASGGRNCDIQWG